MRIRVTIHRLLHLVAAGLLLILVPACSGQDGGTGAVGGPLPAWLMSVTPAPQASFSAAATVRIDFVLPGPGREVRLLVDGVDVTADAEAGAGTLVYRDGEVTPVPLGSGSHVAEARLVQLSVDAVDSVVLEAYRWMFRVG